jgi:hypothetical protein
MYAELRTASDCRRVQVVENLQDEQSSNYALSDALREVASAIQVGAEQSPCKESGKSSFCI